MFRSISDRQSMPDINRYSLSSNNREIYLLYLLISGIHWKVSDKNWWCRSSRGTVMPILHPKKIKRKVDTYTSNSEAAYWSQFIWSSVNRITQKFVNKSSLKTRNRHECTCLDRRAALPSFRSNRDNFFWGSEQHWPSPVDGIDQFICHKQLTTIYISMFRSRT